MKNIRPYVLAENNWKSIKEENFTVAILPWGATEAHNYHLPYSTDNIQVEHMANESARIAWQMGAKPLVLPTIPYGINSGQMDIPFCMNMNPGTQLAILRDLTQVLEAHKIEKLIIFNGHGGNNFKNIIRELSMSYPDIFICSLNWWNTSVNIDEYFDEAGDHAGELETSVMMHLSPELVLPLKQAGDGKEKVFKIKGLKDGWVSAQRKWTSISKDTGVGNPALASSDKGDKFIQAILPDLGKFINELHHADLNNMYE